MGILIPRFDERSMLRLSSTCDACELRVVSGVVMTTNSSCGPSTPLVITPMPSRPSLGVPTNTACWPVEEVLPIDVFAFGIFLLEMTLTALILAHKSVTWHGRRIAMKS